MTKSHRTQKPFKIRFGNREITQRNTMEQPQPLRELLPDMLETLYGPIQVQDAAFALALQSVEIGIRAATDDDATPEQRAENAFFVAQVLHLVNDALDHFSADPSLHELHKHIQLLLQLDAKYNQNDATAESPPSAAPDSTASTNPAPLDSAARRALCEQAAQAEAPSEHDFSATEPAHLAAMQAKLRGAVRRSTAHHAGLKLLIDQIHHQLIAATASPAEQPEYYVNQAFAAGAMFNMVASSLKYITNHPAMQALISFAAQVNETAEGASPHSPTRH